MKKFIFLIFLLACFIRFLYFPDNIYFGFDQARDAFESQNIYQNLDLKIVGPSTAAENLFHGPLYWYLIGSLYVFGNGDPKFSAAFLLIINALGVFLIFGIGKTLFNYKVGILSAIFYAFSFEQTQYALYFGNPAPAVLTTMLFYGGLALLIFRKNWLGLPISLVGLGLSIQFEFFLIYLIITQTVLFFVFRKSITVCLNPKRVTLSVLVFFATVGTFILSDLKFGFRAIRTVFRMISGIGTGEHDFSKNLAVYFDKLDRHINDNIFSPASFGGEKGLLTAVVSVFLFLAIYFLFKKKEHRKQILFLLVWILSSGFLVFFGTSELYYTNIGISSAFILLAAFFISRINISFSIKTAAIIFLILLSNIKLITNQNPNGIINGIYVQEGMILSHEKEAVDYIYKEAAGKPIVISALTMPLKINTTWAYIFNWYGKQKYGYLPYWAGEVALGYPGSLPRWQSQEENYIMFSIIEPTRGIRPAFIQNFLEEQEQYGKVTDEKIFGDKPFAQLKVQKREN